MYPTIAFICSLLTASSAFLLYYQGEYNQGLLTSIAAVLMMVLASIGENREIAREDSRWQD